MQDPYGKVKAGDAIPRSARLHNSFLQTDRSRKLKEYDKPNTPKKQKKKYGIVQVKNTTGDGLDFGTVLSLSELSFVPTLEILSWMPHVVFDGVEPSEMRPAFVVLQQPLPDGAIGDGLLIGITPCEITVTNEDHQCVTLSGGSYNLVSAESGPGQILWKESGTGLLNAIVCLNGESTTESQHVRFEIIPADEYNVPLPPDELPEISEFHSASVFWAYLIDDGDDVDTLDDVQTLTITADGGTFILGYYGNVTAPLAYNISAANLQTALREEGELAYCEVDLDVDGDVRTYTITNPAMETQTFSVYDNSTTYGGGPGTVTITHDTWGYGIIKVHEGRGPSSITCRLKSNDTTGSRGTAVRVGTRWMIVEVQERSMHCLSTLARDVETTDLEAVVGSATPTDGGLTPFNTSEVSGTLTSVVEGIGTITLSGNTSIPSEVEWVKLVWSGGECSALTATLSGDTLTVDFGDCEPPDEGEELSISVTVNQLLSVTNRYKWESCAEMKAEICADGSGGFYLELAECAPEGGC